MVAKDCTIGYYRYTDIAFEWYKTFENPNHMDAINAFLARESLVHSDHPFRQAGDKGAELYAVTLNSGELRLCFSSQQIEYARYYVKAVGLVDITLPLPSSHYLITKPMISTVSSLFFQTPQAIKKEVSKISKNNKRLNNTGDPRLASLRMCFDHTRNGWHGKDSTWLAIDFEAWELRHQDLTEFGYAMCRVQGGEVVETEEGHWIVKERLHNRNTQYVRDNKDNYKWGESRLVPNKLFAEEIGELIARCNSNPGPLYLVFHDAKGDMKILREQLDIAESKEASSLIPETAAPSGIWVVDTSDVFSGLEGNSGDRRKLERMCQFLRLKGMSHFHNAGNDAHWTLEALKAMCSGPPLDAQREARWPGQTETTPMGKQSLKVQRQPWEIDSDYEDMETLFGPNLGPVEYVESNDDEGAAAKGYEVAEGATGP